jgi:hypothetical protein
VYVFDVAAADLVAACELLDIPVPTLPPSFAPVMKTIVYLADGSVEATVRADEFVTAGRARYATPQESADYERAFERADAAAREEVCQNLADLG